MSVLRSNGFKKFQIRTLLNSIRYSPLVAQGQIYQLNNIKNAQLVQNAQDYGNLQNMLDKVQEIVQHHDKMFNQQKNKMVLEESVPESNASAEVEKTPSHWEAEFDYQAEFRQQVNEIFVKEIHGLSAFVKFYMYCKRSFVQDLGFTVSPEHLFDIVEQFRQGRASSRTAIEV
jgi:hypothetical protein